MNMETLDDDGLLRISVSFISSLFSSTLYDDWLNITVAAIKMIMFINHTLYTSITKIFWIENYVWINSCYKSNFFYWTIPLGMFEKAKCVKAESNNLHNQLINAEKTQGHQWLKQEKKLNVL